jgi:hypothetical protein
MRALRRFTFVTLSAAVPSASSHALRHRFVDRKG